MRRPPAQLVYSGRSAAAQNRSDVAKNGRIERSKRSVMAVERPSNRSCNQRTGRPQTAMTRRDTMSRPVLAVCNHLHIDALLIVALGALVAVW